jgi:hypothetical protein
VEFTNEFDWSTRWTYSFGSDHPEYYHQMRQAARLLGTSFLSFGARVIVRDGKVSMVGYAVNNWGGWPRVLGDLVAAQSFHIPDRRGYPVSSIDDESPQFRVRSGMSFAAISPDEISMQVKWTPEAPPELVSHLYRIDLSCAWSLHGCLSARDVAPSLWQDEEKIKAATRARLISRERCPDRILAGRVRYLPAVDILLLEVVDSQLENVNEAGQQSQEFNTDYKLIEVVRGRTNYPNKLSLRYRQDTLSPLEGIGAVSFVLTNPFSPYNKLGDRVLFFTNLIFESCQIVPATPTALSVVRTTVAAPKLDEDQIPEAVR